MRLLKRAIHLAMAGGLLYGAFVGGAYLNPIVTYAVQEVPVDTVTPVLERISKCENGGSHYDKNGQVSINATKDMGKYQINVPIWGKKATEMGLDLSDEKDNEKMAIWLYKNFGTEPWVHSKGCWTK
jgi:hypothetical protein